MIIDQNSLTDFLYKEKLKRRFKISSKDCRLPQWQKSKTGRGSDVALKVTRESRCNKEKTRNKIDKQCLDREWWPSVSVFDVELSAWKSGVDCEPCKRAPRTVTRRCRLLVTKSKRHVSSTSRMAGPFLSNFRSRFATRYLT
ncbi:conserved hypothetical protein [Ricinus communis]|uniref:Uncharacterized protein n=1 Tax=Ricinus communis TaxID=3988 RepID=B9RCK5_RICCO|nr:conserved hypothetical protein [Ricinus communis]